MTLPRPPMERDNAIHTLCQRYQLGSFAQSHCTRTHDFGSLSFAMGSTPSTTPILRIRIYPFSPGHFFAFSPVDFRDPCLVCTVGSAGHNSSMRGELLAQSSQFHELHAAISSRS